MQQAQLLASSRSAGDPTQKHGNQLPPPRFYLACTILCARPVYGNAILNIACIRPQLQLTH